MCLKQCSCLPRDLTVIIIIFICFEKEPRRNDWSLSAQAEGTDLCCVVHIHIVSILSYSIFTFFSSSYLVVYSVERSWIELSYLQDLVTTCHTRFGINIHLNSFSLVYFFFFKKMCFPYNFEIINFWSCKYMYWVFNEKFIVKTCQILQYLCALTPNLTK